MDLVKLNPGKVRRVYLFPEDLYPGMAEEWDTWVEIVELGESANAIYDKHRYMPGRKDATMQKADRVLRDVVVAAIAAWNGITYEGRAVPCTEEWKARLLDTPVILDGERTSMWAHAQTRYIEEVDAERKKSRRSSAISTGTASPSAISQD